MGDFSVKAVLSAVDSNFSSTMKSAMGYAGNLKSTLTGGLGFGIMMGIGQKAFSVVSAGFTSLGKEAIESSDSMQKLQQAMRFSGSSEEEIQRIAGATGTLKTYADKTVFSLEDVMSTFGALSANGIKDADKMTESVGNAVAVFGGGAQEFSSVGLAFSQAMATGALHAQDWNQILNASPQLAGGLRKELMRLNPTIAKDFKGAMEDGEITAELLGEAMNNIGMTEMAQNAATSVTTFEGAMGNLEATVSSGIMSIYDSFAKNGVIDAINGMNDKIGSGLSWLAEAIPGAIEKISPYWNAFKTTFIEVKDAFGDAVGAIIGEVGNLTGSFGSTESVSNFSDIIGTAGDALKKFAGFLEENADVVAKVITELPKLVVAYKGFKIAKAVAPGIAAVSKGVLMLAGKGIGAIAGKLFGIAAAEKATGTASATSAGQIMKAAVAFLAMSAGILLISVGIGLLVFSAIQLAQAGPMAAVALLGLVAAIAVLAGGAALLGPALTAGSVGFVAFGGAIALVGLGALLASAALAVVAAVLPTIIEYGTQGAIVIAQLGLGMLAFALGAGLAGAACIVLGVGLAVVAVGLALVGVAVLILAAGILVLAVGTLLAAAALALVAAVLPTIVEFGTQGAIAIALLGAGMIAFAIGATLAGVACVVLGAGLAVVAVGLALVGVAVLVVAAGVIVLAAGVTLLGAGMLITGAALMVVAGVLPAVATGALLCVASLTLLLAMSLLLTASLLLLTVPLLLLGASFLLASVGILAFGIGMTAASAGVLIMAGALKAVNSSMKSIASNAKTAQKSISSMKSSVSIVNDGLDALGSKAKSAVNKLTSAFSDGAGKAKSAAKSMADGIKSSVQSGLSTLPAVATSAMLLFNTTLKSGGSIAVATSRSIASSVISGIKSVQNPMYGIGLNIGIGLANGMSASLGRVRSIAAQLASEAEKAIRAKAQIHSPSRVTTKLGGFWGGGFVNGIKSMFGKVKRVSQDLITIPSPNIPAFAGIDSYGFTSGDRELRSDYSYNPVVYVSAEVTSVMDGREVGYGSAPYVKEKNDVTKKLKNRIKGNR